MMIIKTLSLRNDISDRIVQHLEWLAGKSCGLRFAVFDEDLSELNFSGLDLRNSSFRGCNLKNTLFKKTNLSFSDMTWCDLSYADFSNANMTMANLECSDTVNTFPSENLEVGSLVSILDKRFSTGMLVSVKNTLGGFMGEVLLNNGSRIDIHLSKLISLRIDKI